MTGPQIRIVPMTSEHAAGVLTIYRAGIDGGDATFETEVPTWESFSMGRLPDHRIVAIGDRVLGWAACSPTSSRMAYAGVVEHSVYVDPAVQGRGVGRILLAALVSSTENAGIWTIQSGIFPENRASLALHRSGGFRVVGTRERLARHYGHWRDVILVERRSPVIN
jgi:L-amino acid N-acyltransferase YncA